MKKGVLTTIEHLKKVSIAIDLLATAGEKLHDSQVILIALGGLGPTYSPFVTSITTWFDDSMRFTTLKQLLLDYERSLPDEVSVNLRAYRKSRGGKLG